MTIDTEAHYTTKGFEGIALSVLGYATEMVQGEDTLLCEDDECDHMLSEMCWLVSEPEEVTNEQMVRAVMVGDDTVHLIDVDDLILIDGEAFCSGCGQIGCAW